MKSILFITLSCFFSVITLKGQFYNNLGDKSGINVSAYIPELNSIANRLIDSLPSTFQSNFRVYSTGFYLHTSDFSGGIPDEFERAIDTVEAHSTYSLLIGREFNEFKQYSKFWVRLKLPSSGIFSCYSENDLAYINTNLANILNSKDLFFVEAERSAMEYLISEISKAKFCCQSGRSPMECTTCPDNISGIRIMMEKSGFVNVPISGLTKTMSSDTNGVVIQNANLQVTLNGKLLNVNADVSRVLNQMSQGMEGVSGYIYFYDPASLTCSQVMSSITEDVEDNYYSIINSQSKKRTRSENTTTYKITVIATTDENNISQIHVKVYEPQNNPKTGKTIYLQCLYDIGEACEIDLHTVKDSLISFYNCLGNYKVTEGVSHTVSLVPDIQTTAFLESSKVKDNTIVLFGTPSEIIHAAQLIYTQLAKEDAYTELPTNDKEFPSICDFYTMDDYFERGVNPGSLALVRTNISPTNMALFNATTIEELDAFLALHATGHNSKIGHLHGTNIQNSYMSSGCVIIVYYFHHSVCEVNITQPIIYNTLHKFIKETMNTCYCSESIKGKIYERFIK